jgi:endoglucanase
MNQVHPLHAHLPSPRSPLPRPRADRPRLAALVLLLLGGAALVSACAPPRRPVGQAQGLPPTAAPAPLIGHNLLYNASFSEGKRSLPWTTSFSTPAEGRSFVDKGELCIEVKNRGANRWDAHLRHQHLLLQQGHTYSFQFKIHASKKTRAYLKIGQAGPPYHEFSKLLVNVDTTPQAFAGTFTMLEPDDAEVEMAFHVGGALAQAPVPFSVCIDDARIDDPQYTEKPEPRPPAVPAVLVNQLGYFPRLAKIATVKNPAAVPWQLLNGRNEVVATGTTIPFGLDKASGDQVSIADFSSYTVEGTGFTLQAAGGTSHPFDIRSDLYRKLKYDALSYYYQTRSGIAIEMPYAGGKQWVRPAGHIGVAPNKGDTSVTCAPGATSNGDGPCTYSLDVSGGWYDAGDQGKYVVNAGISVWTLLNLWERTNALGWTAGDFADGKMNIPENKNGVPDLLDEVRWELAFELEMQVPAGEKLAGMAHHKIHDLRWAPDTMAPQDDPIPRYLQPPSTAATLNLAANGAQAARVWRTIDKAFAEKCRVAAERAWQAALAHPEIYAPQGGEGGGPYDDRNVTDDFYWAAAELYITTEKPEYKDFLIRSEHFKQVTAPWDDNPGMATSMTWGDTRTLGSVSLAIVPNGLPAADVQDIHKNIAAVADRYLALIPKEGYRLPFAVPLRGYPWGSTSFVANNGLMMALAFDLTQDDKYLDGVAQAMDYILGRNALDQSYVTGYGDRPLENPYHRFWCYQANHSYPKPPPGIMSGGANTELQDPYVQAAGLQGCAPQKCFLDNQGAWSVNEITINWNAPLVWITAFLDEKASPRPIKPRPGAAAGAGARKKGKGDSKNENKDDGKGIGNDGAK